MPELQIDHLPPKLARIFAPETPLPARMMAAKGLLPGAQPKDFVYVLWALTADADEGVRKAASTSLAELKRPILEGALSGVELPREVVAVLAEKFGHELELLPRILQQTELDEDTLCALAARASEAMGELIATNEALILKHPAVIEKLYMNPKVRMSTSDRMIELGVRNKLELEFPAYKLAAQAIMSQLIPEPTEEPNIDDTDFNESNEIAERLSLTPEVADVCHLDEEGEEKLIDHFVPLFVQLQNMSVTGKIRVAMLGNATARLLLVRDSNRLVSEAAARSPRMTESEAVQIAASRAVSDEVLRIIANNRELTRSYQVKLNLIVNPRTPFTFTARLLPHLRENDLRQLARSKNVPGAVNKLARQQLERKQ